MVPLGNELVAMLRGVGLGAVVLPTTIESDCETDCVGDPESVILTVNVYVLVDPGAPAIWHVEAISTKPGGKAPETREHVYGGVSPAAIRVALYAVP